MTVAGVLIMGMSVGLFSLSALGMDPFQIFAHGIWRIINTAAGHPVTSEAEMPGTLSFGLCYTVLSAIMLVIVLLINRRKIGLGTVINILFVGYVADFSESLFGKLIPDRSFVTRLIILLVALVILCMASSLYFKSTSNHFALTSHLLSFQTSALLNLLPSGGCQYLFNCVYHHQ
jgi:uncharacterized membrane protein YczE